MQSIYESDDYNSIIIDIQNFISQIQRRMLNLTPEQLFEFSEIIGGLVEMLPDEEQLPENVAERVQEIPQDDETNSLFDFSLGEIDDSDLYEIAEAFIDLSQTPSEEPVERIVKKMKVNPVNVKIAISKKRLELFSPDICAICHENHRVKDSAVMICCGQDIGYDCLKSWLMMKNMHSCPCCRENMPKFNTFRSYNKKGNNAINSEQNSSPVMIRGGVVEEYLEYI